MENFNENEQIRLVLVPCYFCTPSLLSVVQCPLLLYVVDMHFVYSLRNGNAVVAAPIWIVTFGIKMVNN